MTAPAEGDDVIQRVGVLESLERPHGTEMIDARIPSEIVPIRSTVLALVSVALERRTPNPPPLLTVVERATFPLVVVRAADVLREPRAVALERTEDAVRSVRRSRGDDLEGRFAVPASDGHSIAGFRRILGRAAVG